MTEVAGPGHHSASGGGAKKKFATPPVKIACLSWYTLIRLVPSGHPKMLRLFANPYPPQSRIANSCKTRGRDCIYKPSRRGGARVRKKPRSAGDVVAGVPAEALVPDVEQVVPQERMPNDPPEHISIERYIDPGAGLAHLQDWPQDSDLIFDSLFMDDIPDISSSQSGDNTSDMSSTAAMHPIPMVRTYADDNAILEAYYVFVHPFFPILPAPSAIPVDRPVSRLQTMIDDFEEAHEPTSSISLAIAAILALVPHPDDLDYLRPESVLFRRRYAHYLAQSALESIEVENEIPDSSLEPPRALESSAEQIRMRFHPAVPLELESIVALNILSIYEYAQRGNLKKMQSRAGQALMAAMAQSLHLESDEEDEMTSDVKRRIWWMTYISVSQGSIVSNTKPTFEVFAPSFTRKFPLLAVDPEAYTVFIQSQQAILAATQFVMELNKVMDTNGDMSRIYERMRELELFLEPLNTQAELWDLSATITSPLDPAEEIVSRSLRCMARIKLNSARIKIHRYCAFYDMPLFSGKHCDLRSTRSDKECKPDDLNHWPSCSCSTFGNPNVTSLPIGGYDLTTGSPPGTVWPSPNSEESRARLSPVGSTTPKSFPYSSHQSAKICLKSALSIAASYDALPYPNPTGQFGLAVIYLGPSSTVVAPRMMPSFACCAMQCAYALLMVHQKTRSMYPENGGNSFLVESLLVRLQNGLTSILATLENYGLAFEALGGMRDQIRGSVDPYLTAGIDLGQATVF
ncbi:hypothetical protein GQ53DRAFT_818957 [Thozetella sp. PMI_491]|nr:hypothetical protein GQ53DRAFT_818957 [Thozetella sp. PMI_491]